MITETATVVAVSGDTVTLEAAIKSTCSSCQAKDDCGSGVISRAMAPKTQRIEVQTPMTVSVGDVVQVGVPEVGVLSASAWLYMAPLLALVLSAAGLTQLLKTVGLDFELLVVAGSGLITLASFVLVSGHLKTLDQGRFAPVILSVSTPAQAIDIT
ncbi:SoxR reducing system RseC family protein [Salinimonas lutimaris]|uniref:SoxR reducing system RseC family protein n=1 Tax=Salinimonas lutimaris TaxID=914153 RepID=UPI0010BFAECF|nr:SoxR reducing system RseC family protein [Salinimonas lutimaris]